MRLMVRVRSPNILLHRQRAPRSPCKRGASLSLIVFTVGLASLGFLIVTEGKKKARISRRNAPSYSDSAMSNGHSYTSHISNASPNVVAMMQKRAVGTTGASTQKSSSHTAGSSAKRTTFFPNYRVDNFRIEPLLRRNSLTVELSAQLYLNSLSAQHTAADLANYYKVVKCRRRAVGECGNFTIREGAGSDVKDWWEKSYCVNYPPKLGPPRLINNRLTVRLSHLNNQTAPGVAFGGSWAPPSCLSHHSVAIIVPYRDRWRHLTTLLNHLHPILQRQLVRYKIFVVEQYGNETFNKGTVMNAAFLEALQEEIYHCFIFHDVDLIPENDYNMYTCPQMPRHMSVAVNELGYKLPYNYLVGGVLAIKTEHFLKVNGYSNLFWGWGGEDDDMGMRIIQSGLQIIRPVPEVGRYTMIKHVKRTGIEHRVRYKLVRTAKKRYRLDGLNTVQYRLVSKKAQPWFTTLLVDVGTPPPALRTSL